MLKKLEKLFCKIVCGVGFKFTVITIPDVFAYIGSVLETLLIDI